MVSAWAWIMRKVTADLIEIEHQVQLADIVEECICFIV
jgi:hypothetical protein